MYCSNSVLLEQFFLVFNCIFPRFSWFQIDSRNLFHFSQLRCSKWKMFLESIWNLENLGKMQFQTIKIFSCSELEQYPKQNTISPSQ